MAASDAGGGAPKREEAGWVEIGLRRRVGEVEVEGTVRACASDLVVEIARPWALRLASRHIPYFALPAKRWAEAGVLTAEGEREVERLLAAAVGNR
jgi:hypothetical protein